VRFAVPLLVVAVLISASSAGAAVRTDGAISFDVAAGVKRVGRTFAATIAVRDASEVYESYNLTVTVTAPAAIRIVNATSSFTRLACTRGLHSLRCEARVAGGTAETSAHSQIVIYRPTKAGRFKLTAKVAIEDDPNPTNDTATKTVTVKPKPRHS